MIHYFNKKIMVRILFNTICIVVTIAIICCCGHLESYSSLYAYNNSQDSIYVHIGIQQNSDKSQDAYPDTSLIKESPFTKGWNYAEEFRLIAPKSYGAIISIPDNSENFDDFFMKYLPKDTLSVFFIKADTLKRYGYDDVKTNNRISYRYDLSRTNLKAINYNIPYPPTDAMKDMKIVHLGR